MKTAAAPIPFLTLSLFLLSGGSAFVLSAQTGTSRQSGTSSDRPPAVTQTFRDSKGRITGTATTTTTPAGSRVTTYQTGSGTPTNSSVNFPEEGTGTLIRKNVYPNTPARKPARDSSAPILPPAAKNGKTEPPAPLPEKQPDK